jgi:uncharacterized protein
VRRVLGDGDVDARALMSTAGNAAHNRHTIDYIEIPVTDLAAAKAFYAAAFGWSFTDYGPDYAGIQGDRKEVGGLRRDADVRAGGPLIVLFSDDLDRGFPVTSRKTSGW